MNPWIPITVSAALFQTWRTAMQQRLRGTLSVNAAGFVRFFYAIPTGLALLALTAAADGTLPPPANTQFFAHCAIGGLLQIVGTSLLIMSFGFRGFTVGTAYAKTESVQSAIAASIILGEALTPLAWLGIGVGGAGVMVLSLAGRGLAGRELLTATVQPAALCGLGSGLCFSFTSIFIKEANRALGGETLILQALFVLVVTNVLQTLMQGGWMAWREPEQ
jgi:drug/metabolite transporter (DMT)-like permease